eukprot:TRINITY_DN3364_c0_g1_i1.p1 TRINITY_DN3364_c0_g1~~TRINITY_DN3364_c0_g1_i1.p1  ORF type:complete len:290 (+),score=52.07 TRINITY_DN3364_c0_g1_i1:169-1038(+)
MCIRDRYQRRVHGMFLVGIIGWCAAKKESKCLVFIYLIFMIVLTVAFAAVWIATQVITAKKQTDMDEACTDGSETWVQEFKKVFPDKLCSPTASPTIGVFSSACLKDSCVCTTATKIQDCSDADKLVIFGNDKPEEVYFDLMKVLETNFKCTGYCSIYCIDKYYYSDKTKTNYENIRCDKALVDLIKEQAGIIGGVSGACAVVGIVVILSLFCLCCNKEFGKTDEDDKDKRQALTFIFTFFMLSLIHISEPTRPLYISYAVFCLKKKKKNNTQKKHQRKKKHNTNTANH